MKLTSNPITGNASINIQSRVGKLLFILSSSTKPVTGYATDLAGATVAVKSDTPLGLKQIVYETPIIDLMEIAAANEGAVRVTTIGNGCKIQGTVELTPSGAIVPFENETINVEIKGIPTDYTCQVFTLDDAIDANHVIAYEPKRIGADAPVTFNTENAYMVAFPKTALKQVEKRNSNGNRVVFTPEEIEQILSETNPASTIIDGKVTPALTNYYVFDVATDYEVTITSSADVRLFIAKLENRI